MQTFPPLKKLYSRGLRLDLEGLDGDPTGRYSLPGPTMWTPYKDAVALLPLPTVRAHVASSHSRAALFRRGPMGLQTTDWGYGWDSGGWPSVGGRSSRELVCGGCPSQPAKPCSMGTQSAPKRGFTTPQPGPPRSEWAPLRRSGLLRGCPGPCSPRSAGRAPRASGWCCGTR